MGAGAAYADTPPNVPPARKLRGLLEAAQGVNFTVIRVWAHGVLPQYSLMRGPGNYSEAVFAGLDYMLDEARKHNLRVIMVRPLIVWRLLRLYVICRLQLRSSGS